MKASSFEIASQKITDSLFRLEIALDEPVAGEKFRLHAEEGSLDTLEILTDATGKGFATYSAPARSGEVKVQVLWVGNEAAEVAFNVEAPTLVAGGGEPIAPKAARQQLPQTGLAEASLLLALALGAGWFTFRRMAAAKEKESASASSAPATGDLDFSAMLG